MKVTFLIEAELTKAHDVAGAAELIHDTLLDISDPNIKYGIIIKDVYVEGITSTTGRH